MSKFKVGDKVRIKERKGAASDYPCIFTDEMARQKGKIFTIEKIEKLSSLISHKERKFYNGDDYFYLFEEKNIRSFSWHSSMFEPVVEDPEPQISTSLKRGDFITICNMVGKIDINSDYYYLEFDNILAQEHFSCCKKLRELIPNFDKIADEFDTVYNNDDKLFPEFSTINDLIKFVQAVNNVYNSKKSTITSKTLNENEIRFQKPKASCVRGSVPTGRAICGRRRKTAIELGHLSNTTCYC